MKTKSLLIFFFFAISFGYSQNEILDNSKVEFLFYKKQKVEPNTIKDTDKVLKMKLDEEVAGPYNYLGQRIFSQIIKGKQKAYKLTSSNFYTNHEIKPFQRGTDPFGAPTFSKEQEVNKADIVQYLKAANAYSIEKYQQAIYEHALTDADLIWFLGRDCQVFLHKHYFFHPDLQQFVSYTIGARLIFSDYKYDKAQTTLNFEGEDLFIPFAIPALKDFKKLNKDNKSTTWVRQNYELFDFTALPKIKEIAMLKSSEADFIEKHITQPTFSRSNKIYETIDDALANKNEKDEAFLKSVQIQSSVDTVTTFDPETYEEKIVIVKSEFFNFENCRKFYFHETNYLDEKNFSILSKVNFIAPSAERRDHLGNTRYYQRLFVIGY